MTREVSGHCHTRCCHSTSPVKWSRAVHVEVLDSLSVEEFLSAFERFIVRKGRCFKLFTDNGTTFVGTNNELSRILRAQSELFPNR